MKTFKLAENSSIEQLQQQIQFLTARLEAIVKHSGDLDEVLNIKAEPTSNAGASAAEAESSSVSSPSSEASPMSLGETPTAQMVAYENKQKVLLESDSRPSKQVYGCASEDSTLSLGQLPTLPALRQH